MLKQLDIFKIPGYLMISQRKKSTSKNKVVYNKKYGSYAGLFLTILVFIMGCGYFGDLVYNMLTG